MESSGSRPRAQETLPEELVEKILLRLDEAADLVRASAACTSFLRLVNDPAFLRRFRRAHPPPILGFLDDGIGWCRFRPARAPHPCAPAARAVMEAADFAFSFLPRPGRWVPRDSRDGRILVARDLKRLPRGRDGTARTGNLAVCDPLSRRYVLLPPIPWDLTGERGSRVGLELLLAPGASEEGEDEEVAEASFRVVAMLRYEMDMAVSVFSSRTAQWCGHELDGWNALPADLRVQVQARGLCCPIYANRCFHWPLPNRDALFVLDLGRMGVFTIDLPRGTCRPCDFGISETGEGTIAVYSVPRHPRGAGKLWYTVRRTDGKGANVWHSNLEFGNSIPLPGNYRCCIAGESEGYLLLRGVPQDWAKRSSTEELNIQYFSLELKTMQLKRMCGLRDQHLRPYRYTGFPPSLSPPRI